MLDLEHDLEREKSFAKALEGTRGMGEFWYGSVALVGLFTILAMIAASALTAIGAAFFADGSFAQSLLVEISAGIATLLVAPCFLKLGAAYKWQAPSLGLVAATACGVSGYRTVGLMQSFLIEAAGALSLLVIGDLLLLKWLDGIGQELGADGYPDQWEERD